MGLPLQWNCLYEAKDGFHTEKDSVVRCSDFSGMQILVSYYTLYFDLLKGNPV